MQNYESAFKLMANDAKDLVCCSSLTLSPFEGVVGTRNRSLRVGAQDLFLSRQ